MKRRFCLLLSVLAAILPGVADGTSLPDLAALRVEVSGARGDWQSLQITGSVVAVVANLTTNPVNQPFVVTVFEDVNANGQLDPASDAVLGTVQVPQLPGSTTNALTCPVAGSVRFRGSPVYAFVDSGGAIEETDESNNVTRSGITCGYRPEPGPFTPVLKWAWTNSTVLPTALNVMMTPAVADLNGDGVPEVVFGSTASTGGGYVEVGYLRALNGSNGAELFTVTNAAYRINTVASIAVGDIDLDSRPEIIACDDSGARLIAFEHDGTFKWRSPTLEAVNLGAPAIADLDGDGTPEIIIGRQVLNSGDGSIRWTGGGGRGSQGSVGPLSIVADVNLDGQPEVVCGNTVYAASGTNLWRNGSVPDGLNAVANFDNDSHPEIVLVGGNSVWLLEHTGAVKWGPVSIPGGGGGAPTVADFDGDGQPEVGVAGSVRYVVLDRTGAIKWQAVTRDSSSGVTGSTVFDFRGDGSAQVVYRDELKLHIFRGSDGAVLFETNLSSCAWQEYPVAADVDADGHAEIVAVANNSCGFGVQRGVFVFGDELNAWVGTRPIWNQHSYHLTNVRDDSTIPAVEPNNWQGANSYRQNRLTPVPLALAPDVTASWLRTTGSSNGVTLTARIGSAGAVPVPPGVSVGFYRGNPSGSSVLLGTAATTNALNPGEFGDVSLSLSSPTGAIGAIYVWADNTTGLSECDEANNLHSVTNLDCNANGVPDVCDIANGISADCNTNGIPDECDALPDLRLLSCAGPALTGPQATFTWVVQNVGTHETEGDFLDGIYLSQNEQLDGAAILLGLFTNPAPLNPAATYTQSQVLTLPAGSNGPFWLIARADVSNAISELCGKADNTRAAAVVIDTEPPTTALLTGPPEGSCQPAATQTFTFAGTDNLSPAAALVFAWRVDGGAWNTFGSLTSAIVTGLSDGWHVFEVKARDEAGNEEPAPPARHFLVDTTPPNVPVVTDDGAFTRDPTTLRARWTAADAESAITGYAYSIRRSGDQAVIVDWQPAGTNTSVVHAGLSLEEGRTYYFAVKAVNCAGRESVPGVSDGITLDTTPPVISQINAAPSEDTCVITWHTDEPASALVEYGRTTAYGSTATGATPLVTSHRVVAAGLAAGTLYHFRVRSAEGATNEAVSADVIFTSAPAPDLVVPSITAPTNGFADEAVNISWTVRNQGGTTATGPWVDRVFASPDGQLSGSFLLGSFTYSGTLAPDAAYERFGSVHLPGRTGSYRLIVITDYFNRVPEYMAKTNNLTVDDQLIQVIEYRVSVETDVTSAPAGTPIPLRGRTYDPGTSNALPNLPATVRILTATSRRVFPVTSDTNGLYALEFQPAAGEAGLYSVAADRPSVAADVVQDQFTLAGMVVSPSRVAHAVAVGSAQSNSVTLLNLGNAPLSGITAVVESVPAGLEVQVNVGGFLSGGGSNTLSYSVRGTAPTPAPAYGSKELQKSLQEPARVRLTSAEGATATLSIYGRAVPKSPELIANPGTLIAGMLRGRVTTVRFDVANVGGAPSGDMQVMLPDVTWMSVSSTPQVASLQPGTKASVTLELSPPATLGLGRYEGTIVVGGPMGGVSIPFVFTAVSELRGGLQVSVVDEFTFYAAGSPKVTNAVVTLLDPYTGTNVASVVTGPSGEALFPDLAEAYYKVYVRAPQHGDFNATVLVAATRVKTVSAFLPRQVVSYHWVVTPTEIQDRYLFTLESTFETYVPAPVVTIEPASFDLSQLGCAVIQTNITISNHGLIAARGLELKLNNHPNWEITSPVTRIGDLAAQGSIVVPITIRCVPGTPAGPCNFEASLDWYLPCGPANQYYRASITFLHARDCWMPPRPIPSPPVVHPDGREWPGWVWSGWDWCWWLGWGGCVGIGEWYCWVNPEIVIVDDFDVCVPGLWPGVPHINVPTFDLHVDYCDPCLMAIGQCAVGYALDTLGLSVWLERASIANDCLVARNPTNCLRHLVDYAVSRIPLVGPLLSRKDCLCGLATACPLPPGLKEPVTNACQFVEDSLNNLAGLMGNPIWAAAASADSLLTQGWLGAFSDATLPDSEEGLRVSTAERQALLAHSRPSVLTDDPINALLDRWNRTLDYANVGIVDLADVPAGWSTDFMAGDVVRAGLENDIRWMTYYLQLGYTGFYDGPRNAVEMVRAYHVAQQGVCARIRLRIQQEMVLTRSAFLGTLELENNSGSALSNILVTLDIRDTNNVPVNDRFGLRPPQLQGLSAVDGTGVLTPGASGSAMWTIIPARTAAPEAPATYYVGGTLAYSVDGQWVTNTLFPDDITVMPDPNLGVKYFWERDVYSDDPFTPEVEPAVPFSLGLMIGNTGHGTAKDVRINSGQPEIVDNDKGLLVDFRIIGSQVGSNAITPSLNVSMGNIEPGQTAVARWLLTSSLRGRFVDYSATFQHLDAIGNINLSLVDSVEIHELVHVVRADYPLEDGIPDFLVNDEFIYSGLLPDKLYLSNGGEALVNAVTNATVDAPPSPGHLNVQVTATMPAGWTYVEIPDPAEGAYLLTQVTRSDGKPIRMDDNAWTTHRIIRLLGQPPRWEHLFRLLDHDSTGQYTLTYQPLPPQDTNAPVSAVLPLPTNSYPRIPLQWSGQDEPGGSGLAFFDVYVSTNGGPFSAWLSHTTMGGAVYPGVLGNAYAFYTRATDAAGNGEAPPLVPDAVTTVCLSNRPPVITPVGDQVVRAGDTLALDIVALDPDPTDRVTYSLAPGAPAGTALDPLSGLFTYAASSVLGPSTNWVTVVVTDSGAPSLSTSNQFRLITIGSNRTPQLAAIPDWLVSVGELLIFTNHAVDLDYPPQTLRFSLASGAPAGAGVNPTNGIFRWLPTFVWASTTNPITVRVTDNGSPPATDEKTFIVMVSDYLAISLGSTPVRAGDDGEIPLNCQASAKVSELAFEVSYPPNRWTNLTLRSLSPLVGLAAIEPLSDSASRFRVQAKAGQEFFGNVHLAQVAFSTFANQSSAFVPLSLTNLEAFEPGGSPISRVVGSPARLVVIAENSLLEAGCLPTRERFLTVYGKIGTSYVIESKTNLTVSAPWQPVAYLTLSNASQVVLLPVTSSQTVFYQAREILFDQLPRLEARVLPGSERSLVLHGEPGRQFVVERTTNLGDRASWEPALQPVLLTNSIQTVIVPDHPAKAVFYRSLLVVP